ncbi:TrbC/VirB2 family protein [Paracoccus sp. SY]|uniref:TrbC/VirB2 family protein n=1 Tax=Paracoccus sp. SY TaxID=1330255 RepID=UPI000CD02FF0
MAPSRLLMPALLAAILVTAVSGDALAQSGVDFTKADTVGNDFVAWIRGNIATVFFTVALVLAGFAAAFNKISWMWVLMIAVGAFLVFGAPGFVADLKAVFS